MKSLRVNIPPPPRPMEPGEALFALGSCFAEAMALRLQRLGCDASINPFGTIYNSHSLAILMARVMENRVYLPEDFFEYQGRWFSWEHATGLWGRSCQEAVDLANVALESAHQFAQRASVFLVTFGSSAVFSTEFRERPTIVANCQKMPQSFFRRRLLSVKENESNIRHLVESIQARRPEALIVLSLSPIRHDPQRLCENGLSKANLRAAIGSVIDDLNSVEDSSPTGHASVESSGGISGGSGPNSPGGGVQGAQYFPAYEIAFDELRDRIHYAADGTHLRPHAVNHIAMRFGRAYFSPRMRNLQRDLREVRKMSGHRHINPNSPEAQEFDLRLAAKKQAFRERWGWSVD